MQKINRAIDVLKMDVKVKYSSAGYIIYGVVIFKQFFFRYTERNEVLNLNMKKKEIFKVLLDPLSKHLFNYTDYY